MSVQPLPMFLRLMGPRRKLTNAIARWHSQAVPFSNQLEQVYADRVETAMQEMAIQLSEVLLLLIEMASILPIPCTCRWYIGWLWMGYQKYSTNEDQYCKNRRWILALTSGIFSCIPWNKGIRYNYYYLYPTRNWFRKSCHYPHSINRAPHLTFMLITQVHLISLWCHLSILYALHWL